MLYRITNVTQGICYPTRVKWVRPGYYEPMVDENYGGAYQLLPVTRSTPLLYLEQGRVKGHNLTFKIFLVGENLICMHSVETEPYPEPK